MPVTINNIEAQQEWNSICELFDDAQFPQSFEWGEAKQIQGWEPVRLSFDKGGECIGAAQVLIKTFLGLTIAYCPRGPLWQRRKVSLDRCLLCLPNILKALQDRFLKSPFLCDWHCEDQAMPDQLLVESKFVRLRKDMTSWVALCQNEDDIYGMLHQKWRNDLVAAKNANVCVRNYSPLSKTEELFRLLKEMAGRKNFRIGVDPDVVNKYLRQRDASKDFLMVAHGPNNDPLSYALFLSFNGFVNYLVGASLPSGHPKFVRGASNLLQWEAMRYAKLQGSLIYNLEGLDSKVNPGVYHFKKRMNGKIFVQKGLWMWNRNSFQTVILGKIVEKLFAFWR